MGKVSYSNEIGDKQESFDIKIDEQSGDIEIRDLQGNIAFPTPKLIKELYKEIIRLEISCGLRGSGRGGLFTRKDLADRYGITESQIGWYLNKHEIYEDEADRGTHLYTHEKVLRIDKERGI